VPVTSTVNTSISEVPDLSGMSAREALRVLTRLGCTAHLRGAGVVVDQWPAPGTPLDSGMNVVLTLDRRPIDRVASAEAP
jgi:cell division protein FtsI (penicillin-binding protein 3)